MKLKHYSLLASFLYSLLIFGLLNISCTHVSTNKKQDSDKTGSANIKYAKGFSVDYYDHYKLVNIFTGSGANRDTVQYVLIPRGGTAPKGYKKAQLIQIPVTKMAVMSSTHVAMADFADAADVIVGLGSLRYVSSDAVRKNIAAGKVKEVGAEGMINDEVVLTMKPGLVMVMGDPEAKLSKYQTLTGGGIPVMLNSEWLETTPLARAEWVKLVGILVGKEELVNTKFAVVEKEYNRLAAMGKKAAFKPTLITGMPYKGIWYVPDANSYMTEFFKDAGTNYKWADIKGTGSLPLNFETVAPIALEADYWINVGDVDSKKGMKDIDVRYADFKPFKTDKVYNYNLKINENGSNDFWESGAVYPQLVLADLIKILHPELLPGHHFVYYKQLN